jgi:Na+-translocating ferredoxin:NAD+ oxidoreductase subunit D
MIFTISLPPHIKSRETILRIRLSMFLALLPAGIWRIVLNGSYFAYIILTSVISCILVEYIFGKFVFKRKVKIGNGGATLIGFLMAYCISPEIPLWQIPIGAFFAIFIAKECLRRIDYDIFNPVVFGQIILSILFPISMANDILQASQLFSIQEILLVLGALYLFQRKIISWHISIVYILTVFILSVVFKQSFSVSYGLILGAFFIATDYSTSPLFSSGKIIFGFGLGLLTVLIRHFGFYPESIWYPILIMNVFVPLLNKFTKPRAFGLNLG